MNSIEKIESGLCLPVTNIDKQVTALELCSYIRQQGTSSAFMSERH
jgi:hypothetical protein